VTHLPPIFAFLLILPLAVGCKSSADAASAEQQARERRRQTTWEETPLNIEQKPVAVVEGETPLLHIFDLGAPVRIVDLTTGVTLVSSKVPSRTLVRIDDRNGVTVGPDNILPGPLTPGHRYAIYADPVTPNVVRQGTGPPGDVPR
jgi:hypothetical protein